MKQKKLYAEICKTEKQDDGTIKVWGYASSEAVDSDGEVITSEAMKAALPDYMKFGAVREMHQASAAGTAIEANVEDDGRTFFGAHVVDPVAVKKVETQTYKGFSIGGKVTSRDSMNKTIITGLNLIEVSLVDRPANPEAVFTMFKADGIPNGDGASAVDQLAEMLNKGEVTPEQLLEMAKGSLGGTAVGSGSKDLTVQIGQEETEKLAKAAKADSLKKCMYDVSSFASLLNSIGYLAGDAEWEAQYEGDESPIPQALREWLAQGIGIFQAMAAEETSEMMARLQANVPDTDPVVSVIEAGDKTGNLAKAGAKFSTATKEALGAAHEAMKAACDHMDKLGYKDSGDDENKDDDGDGDGNKAASTDDLNKRHGETLSKVAQLEQDLAKSQARIQELEAMPAPGKALLKAISISKSADNAESPQQAEPDPIRKADGSIDGEATAVSLVKFMHQSGGVKFP
jgi:hypothetical protein